MDKKKLKAALAGLDAETLDALRCELGLKEKLDNDVLDTLLDLSQRVSILEGKTEKPAPDIPAPEIPTPEKSFIDKIIDAVKGEK